MVENFLIVFASFLAAIVATPVVRRCAIKFGIVDSPDPHRKLHSQVIARAGGTALLSSVLVVCLFASLRFDWRQFDLQTVVPYLGLLVAMIGIWLVGLADDIWSLRGRQKLFFEFLLAGLLVGVGFQIRLVTVFGFSFELGIWSIPLSIAWLLATTNALNLMDGADGVCATLGAIICGGLGVLAAMHGHLAEAAIAFSFSGALLGFLVFNFPPASIFLGDSGSLLVGMVAGALAMRCGLKGEAGVAMMGPMTILFLPLLDSLMAVLRRKLTGRSIYTTDRAHLHHTLRSKGFSERGMLLVVSILALTTTTGALGAFALGREWLAPASVLLVFVVLVASRGFGYAELALVARRSAHFAMSLLEPAARTDLVTRQGAVRLQGTRQWETVWQILVEFAEREHLSKLHLDFNVPWLEEGFHGSWQRSQQPDRLESWTALVPVHAGGRIAGRLTVIGPAKTSGSLGAMAKLVELLDDLAPEIERIIQPKQLVASPVKRGFAEV